jgi:hypothetical protein
MFTLDLKTLAETKTLKSKKRGNLLATITQTEAKPVLKEINQIQVVYVPVEIEVLHLGKLLETWQKYLPQLHQNVSEGLESPLEAFAQIRKVLHIGEYWLEQLKTTALAEAENLHKDELYLIGFEISHSGEVWNYQEDAEYLRLEIALKQRKELLKVASRHRKAFLDENSGEMIQPVSLKTTATPYLKTVKPKS